MENPKIRERPVLRRGLVLAASISVIDDLTAIFRNAGISHVHTFHELKFGPGADRSHLRKSPQEVIASMIYQGIEKNPFYVAIAHPGDYTPFPWDRLDPQPNCPLILHWSEYAALVNEATYTPRGDELDFARTVLLPAIQKQYR